MGCGINFAMAMRKIFVELMADNLEIKELSVKTRSVLKNEQKLICYVVDISAFRNRWRIRLTAVFSHSEGP